MNKEQLRLLSKSIVFSLAVISEVLSATPVSAEVEQRENPAFNLKLEDWQKGALRLGLAGLLTGAFALRVGTTLRQNEGSTLGQKRWNKTGLITQGASTAFLDCVILTTAL
ncbi:MAG: hypothetical protein Q8Q65_02830 [bacterium]|nr:hypothetical protein [bacterium]